MKIKFYFLHEINVFEPLTYCLAFNSSQNMEPYLQVRRLI
jgi:hypothetical protein